MFFPLRTDSPLRGIPWANWSLILLNVLIFLATTNTSFDWHAPLATFHGQPVKIALALNPQSPALWQYFTYQFLHENWMHIIGNMVALYIFGNNINDRMGHFGYLGFYLAGGVFAGLGHAYFAQSPVVGASGAIAAVTGAYLVLLPRSNILVVYFFFLIGVVEIPSILFILFYFSQDVIGQFWSSSGGEAVAHLAHISGTLFGVVVSLALLAIGLLPRDPFDVLSLATRWNRRRQYRSLVSRGYNPFAHAQPQNFLREVEPEVSPHVQQIMDLRAEISEAIAHRNLPRAATLYLQLQKLEPSQVLPRQSQLDIANQLASQQLYPQAAQTYEQFLREYPNFEQIDQVQLMLGIIYSRYLQNPARARQLLLLAVSRLHGATALQLARAELSALAAQSSGEPAAPSGATGV